MGDKMIPHNFHNFQISLAWYGRCHTTKKECSIALGFEVWILIARGKLKNFSIHEKCILRGG